MFSLVRWVFRKAISRPQRNVLVLGVSCSGKSVLLNELRVVGAQLPVLPVLSTIGQEVVSLQYGGMVLQCTELGGHPGFRPAWPRYYAATHAVVWVMRSPLSPSKDEEDAAANTAAQSASGTDVESDGDGDDDADDDDDDDVNDDDDDVDVDVDDDGRGVANDDRDGDDARKRADDGAAGEGSAARARASAQSADPAGVRVGQRARRKRRVRQPTVLRVQAPSATEVDGQPLPSPMQQLAELSSLASLGVQRTTSGGSVAPLIGAASGESASSPGGVDAATWRAAQERAMRSLSDLFLRVLSDGMLASAPCIIVVMDGRQDVVQMVRDTLAQIRASFLRRHNGGGVGAGSGAASAPAPAPAGADASGARTPPSSAPSSTSAHVPWASSLFEVVGVACDSAQPRGSPAKPVLEWLRSVLSDRVVDAKRQQAMQFAQLAAQLEL